MHMENAYIYIYQTHICTYTKHILNYSPNWSDVLACLSRLEQTQRVGPAAVVFAGQPPPWEHNHHPAADLFSWGGKLDHYVSIVFFGLRCKGRSERVNVKVI